MLAVAAEALHNTVKHAGAKRVVVLLEDSAEGVGLVITDDGKGFVDNRIDELPQEGHFGLLGMRERANRVGGCLSVRSTPGRGTTVRLSLPSADKGLQQAAARPAQGESRPGSPRRRRAEVSAETPDVTTPVRVLIADDNAVIRMGLRLLLEAESAVEVVGEATTAPRRWSWPGSGCRTSSFLT